MQEHLNQKSLDRPTSPTSTDNGFQAFPFCMSCADIKDKLGAVPASVQKRTRAGRGYGDAAPSPGQQDKAQPPLASRPDPSYRPEAPLRLPPGGPGSRALPPRGCEEAGLRERRVPSFPVGGPVSWAAAELLPGAVLRDPGATARPAEPAARTCGSTALPRPSPQRPAARHPPGAQSGAPHTPAPRALTSVTGQQVCPQSPRCHTSPNDR